MNIKKFNDFSITEAFGARETMYGKNVKWSLHNIICDINHISEKDFTRIDELKKTIDVLFNLTPEISDVIRRYEKNKSRPSYCAEHIYQWFIKDSEMMNDINEKFKHLLLGVLLFLASCTNVKIENQYGEKIEPPISTEIKGVVDKQFKIPGHDYHQKITVTGEDGNTYKYKVTSNMLINKSWKVHQNDSVRMEFDENGDSKIYKIK